VRATKAYIASFGTTGTLIAAALLTMSVMSAIVAFDGFPGQDIQDPIGSVPVVDRQAPLAVEKHQGSASTTHARHAKAVSARHHKRSHRHAGQANTPVAHANSPAVHRESTPQTQTPQQPGSSSSTPVKVPDTSSVTSGVTNTVPATPSVPAPSTLLQTSPVTLPGGKTLPVDLPVNTGAVSGAVDSLLGQ
jgi:hypothetical protein